MSMSPRPPPLMILNEPETSLHPDLLSPLARPIAKASRQSRVIVVSHAEPLVSALQEAGAKRIVLEKQLGETVVPGEERPVWNWPSR
jgi:predicted ATPase